MSADMDALHSQHWLKFDDQRHIKGCQCGFVANLDSDGGWGDSVVSHLIEVGSAIERVKASLRAPICKRCTTEVQCDRCETCLYHHYCDGGTQ